MDSANDNIAIKLKLNKGPIASVHLHDIRACLYDEDEVRPPIELGG